MSQFIEMLFKKPITGKIGDLVDKKIFSVKKIHSMNDIIEYIDISSVERSNHSIVETTSYVVSNAPSRAQQCVRLDDILVSTVRPINRNIAVVNSDKNNLVASTGFCVLRPKLAFKEYLLAIVQSDKYTEAMIDKASGGLYPAVNNGDVLNYGIYIPDEEFAKKFSLIYQQADKSKFGDFKSQFIEMFGNPLFNTKKWRWYSNINNVVTIVLGSTPNTKEPKYWDGDIKWITPAEMDDETFMINDTLRHITEFGVKSANLTKLPVGSVLFSTRAPIGKVGIAAAEMYCNQGFKSFICSNQVDSIFLYYTLKLNKEYLCSLGTGTTFKELSKKTVEGLKLGVPPFDLQKQFAIIYKQADKSKSYVRIALKNLESILGYCIRQVA